MIIGIGTDIVKVSRMADTIGKYGEQFLDRCFTATERARSESRHDPIRAYARLFAAKEALLKALGTGMREGLAWHDWEITPDAHGAPIVAISGGSAGKLAEKTLNIRLSMSDDGDYAVAYAVIESLQ